MPLFSEKFLAQPLGGELLVLIRAIDWRTASATYLHASNLPSDYS